MRTVEQLVGMHWLWSFSNDEFMCRRRDRAREIEYEEPFKSLRPAWSVFSIVIEKIIPKIVVDR